ncbi:hypothetical protein Xentx_03633 [Xenorhabdus thuongxuanensis]|uniref:Uncharacterized protein n=1 Tax=Xenorhabdus thuongxuanensis TaxID=1873484 RepID=A0A1Q5TEE1_9GAMM|nr:hypothetical protein Xentx_03633 [Xenorhabdus thuongxuanensis]
MSYLQHPSSSGMKLFADLIGKRIIPGELWYSSGTRTKFALRSLLTPISTLKLLNGIRVC